MNINELNEMKELVDKLNNARNAYYNNSESIISDYEYDIMFDKLSELENKSQVFLSNSPTQTVGYEVKSELQKVVHSHLMLSLDKTKSVQDLYSFIDGKPTIVMHKLDGLTILLTYDNGVLIRAETRGDSETGEDITHNAKVFSNVPLKIPYKGKLEIEGEAIITHNTFEQINSSLMESEHYKNPRNLVSGSVRQLDNSIAASRGIKFIAWKVPHGLEDIDCFSSRLNTIFKMGFDIVPYIVLLEYPLEMAIEDLKEQAKELGYPIDGLVLSYESISYGESLGMTGHHPRHSLAFKFYDEELLTILRGIEWTMGKTGVLTPTAVFDPVNIDGTEVSRASLHNISICKDLKIGIGDEITVYKANQIIPQVKESLTKSNNLVIPVVCPICGERTIVVTDNNTSTLNCTNDLCKGKLLGKLSHFVSKPAMNIDGLSEATIKKFIEKGWLEKLSDIYRLEDYKKDMISLDGFGEKSVTKLLKSIDKSREVRLQNLLCAISIPLIGKTASKDISKYCNNSISEFISYLENHKKFSDVIDGVGDKMDSSLCYWWENNKDSFISLLTELIVGADGPSTYEVSNSSKLHGITFCITGALNAFENRDKAKETIEANGGKVSSSVSSKTNYLINNDIVSTTGKNKKAKELGIEIITENQLLDMLT